jgi:hypothetical protein
MGKNQLLNAVLQKLTTDPASPVSGQIYYNTTNSVLKYYDGTAWKNSGDMTGDDIVAAINASTSSIIDARLSAAAQAAVTNSHTHSNKSTLDLITAAFTTAYATKLDGIEAGANITDAANIGTSIYGSAAKTSLVDADQLALLDSAASNVLKKITYASVKAALKTYFDTVYNMYTHPSGDGNLHVPATSTTNGGKFLKAGSTAGSISWASLAISDVASLQTTLDAKETPTGAQNKATTAETNAKAYTDTKISDLIGGAGTALDTLNELAAALGDDPNFATTTANAIASKTGKAAVTIGDGTATTFTVNHTLNTQDVVVLIRESASPYAQVIADVEVTSVTSVKISFALAPTSGQYRVIIVG